MAQVSSDLFVQGLYREIEWCCGRVTNFLLRICLLRPFYHFRQRRLKLSWRAAVLSDDLVYDLGYTKWSEGGLGSFSLTGVASAKLHPSGWSGRSGRSGRSGARSVRAARNCQKFKSVRN